MRVYRNGGTQAGASPGGQASHANFPFPSANSVWKTPPTQTPTISFDTMIRSSISVLALAAAMAAPSAFAHDVAGNPSHDHEATNTLPLAFARETKGPVPAPKATKPAAGLKVTGQGFWKFVAAPELVPVPAEAQTKLKPAHGTLVVDKENDTVYWGLQSVGWIGFSNGLEKSWIVQGDPVMAKGNLHGADILPRKGKTALIAAADNTTGQIFLTDTTFQKAEILRIPEFTPYADKRGFAPTDVAFVGEKELWVTDGYGKAWFMPATVSPFQYGQKFFGGKPFSGTPHGITYDPSDKSLLVSARPEGLVKRFDLKHQHVHDIEGLPAGSTVCDVDVWGDYALAPCLDGPGKSNGPIYIINLKNRTVVSTLRVKDDLGYDLALHIHDACWYVRGRGASQEVYVLFTNWNPGGIGAIKLVNIPD